MASAIATAHDNTDVTTTTTAKWLLFEQPNEYLYSFHSRKMNTWSKRFTRQMPFLTKQQRPINEAYDSNKLLKQSNIYRMNRVKQRILWSALWAKYNSNMQLTIEIKCNSIKELSYLIDWQEAVSDQIAEKADENDGNCIEMQVGYALQKHNMSTIYDPQTPTPIINIINRLFSNRLCRLSH